MPRQPQAIASSPNSSTEATHFGTPSTNITVMSPEGCDVVAREQVPRFDLRINTSSAVRASATNTLQLQASSAQLSPTADEFTPRSSAFSFHPRSAGTSGAEVSPVQNLVVGSMPDRQATSQEATHGAVGQASTWAIRNVELQIPLDPEMRVIWNKFSMEDKVTRAFQVFDQTLQTAQTIFTRYVVQFPSLATIDTKHIYHGGIIRLVFNDERDAKQAYALTRSMILENTKMMQLSAKDVAAAHGKDPRKVSDFEGQLLITVMYTPVGLLQMPTLQDVYDNLKVFGDVKAIMSLDPLVENSTTFRVEYHNVEHAKLALNYLPQASKADVRYAVARYEPDVAGNSPRQPVSRLYTDFGQPSAQPSLTGRSTIPTREFAQLEGLMARVMREPSNTSRGPVRTGHNVVDIGRIEAGLDVRTTIMLRNIPNRVDQENLKNLIDVTSFGHYDFMYLRIDFANDCNVGYAFINFVDPLAIIPFARARAGRRWNVFNSDKIAEISYATIQGRDCLVQKFRNSSVMLEHPSYRPKLFFTHPSPQAGHTEPFPEPDNYSKMRRSIDNAEHIGLFRLNHHRNIPHNRARRADLPANVRRQLGAPAASRSGTSTPLTWASSTTSSSTDSGLFAPREGQAHREEQRRRRSQYDRGTPGAEIELSSLNMTDAGLDYNTAYPQRLANVLSRLYI